MIPDGTGKLTVANEITFSSENTRRLPEEQRSKALAKLCLENGWPATAVAPGIPFVCASLERRRISAKISGILRPHLGAKAHLVVAAADAPEVLAVVSAALHLGTRQIQVPEPLRTRIQDIYIGQALPKWFNTSWTLPTDRWTPLADVIQQLHTERRIPVDRALNASGMRQTDLQRWVKANYLAIEGDELVAMTCQCGSTNLALIPTPEPNGLVCLECRQDRSGLIIPESWNSAVANRDYWSHHGYTLEVPPLPGIRTPTLPVEPLHLR